MHYENMDDLLADASAAGAEFYVEVRDEALYLRTVAENKLVLLVSDTVMMFYDPMEIDIYRIDETNAHENHAIDLVNMMLDKAWNRPGFGDRVKQELDYVVEELRSSLNDSETEVDNV